MENLLIYKDLKNFTARQSYKLAERFKYIEEILNIDNVIKSYGKNIFNKTSEQEVYFITSEKIIHVTIDPFIIKTYNIQDIKNIEIAKNNNYEIVLKIYTEEKSIIELDNKKDSNEDWENEYFNYISDIANYLVNLKSS